MSAPFCGPHAVSCAVPCPLGPSIHLSKREQIARCMQSSSSRRNRPGIDRDLNVKCTVLVEIPVIATKACQWVNLVFKSVASQAKPVPQPCNSSVFSCICWCICERVNNLSQCVFVHDNAGLGGPHVLQEEGRFGGNDLLGPRTIQQVYHLKASNRPAPWLALSAQRHLLLPPLRKPARASPRYNTTSAASRTAARQSQHQLPRRPRRPAACRLFRARRLPWWTHSAEPGSGALTASAPSGRRQTG